MARVYFADGVSARSTTTSSTYGDHCTLTFTPNASKTIAIFWGCMLDHSSDSSDARARLYHDTAAAALQTFNIEPQDTTDVFPVSGLAFYTSGGSPTAQTFSVEFSAEAGTTGCADSYIIALELVATDLFATTAAQSTTTSTSYQTLETLTTPGAGDFLLIASAEISGSASNAAMNWRLGAGGSDIVVTGPSFLQDASNDTPLWLMARAQPGGSTAYDMEYKASGPMTQTVRARNRSVLALDLSAFDDFGYAESLGSQSTSSSSDQTAVSLTKTPSAAAYLQLFAATSSHSNTGNSQLMRFERASTLLTGTEISREPNNSNEQYDHGRAVLSDLAASSTVWRTLYRTEVSNTTNVKNAVIAVLQVGGAASTTYTLTTALSAAIQAAQTQTVGLNAAIRAAQAVTAGTDAAIQAQGQAAAGLDAALQAALMASTDIDAAIQATGEESAAIDAVIRASASLTANLSAAIQAARSVTVGMDAVIDATAAQTVTAAFDAAIEAAQTASLGMDAVIAGADAVVVALGGGGSGWKRRRQDFTDWWVEWSKARKRRHEKRLADEVAAFRRETDDRRTIAALDALNFERTARMEAELRAIQHESRMEMTKRQIEALLTRIAEVRAVLEWAREQAEIEDEEILLLAV